MLENAGVGFFGKLPALGDFVNRRLSREFMEAWDRWLQSSMRTSQEVHGENWLSLFLVSPIWRFALSPGLCGSNACAGIVMPSVDRVGRYYPLTLAQEVPEEMLTELFCMGGAWFAELENLALTALSEQFDLDQFDHTLQNIALPPCHVQSGYQSLSEQIAAAQLKSAYRFDMASLDSGDYVFPSLTQLLLKRFAPAYSFWASKGSQFGQANVLFYEGLPPIDTYGDFLQGLPKPTKSWNCQMFRLTLLETAASRPFMAEQPQAVVASYPVDTTSQWHSYGITDVGNRRKHNEDAMLNAPELGLWVVADGMGGHQSGDMASQKIVQTLAQTPPNMDLEMAVEWISDQLRRVNDYLCDVAQHMQRGSVIGSTVVCLVARGDQCVVIWAGDSRLYRLRNGILDRVTRDHTLLDELIHVANVSREAAMQQVGANVITRAVGGQAILELDKTYFQAQKGDCYLLCSDGLDKEVTEAEIAEWMACANSQTTVQGLIDLALNRNGIDNITVINAVFC
jgi:type VI secretion system protein ImpM